MTLEMKPFKNIVGKGENAFSTMFSTLSKVEFSFCVKFILSSANSFNLDWPKIMSLGKGLIHSHTMTPFDAPGKQAF